MKELIGFVLLMAAIGVAIFILIVTIALAVRAADFITGGENELDGCVASALQATRYGHDLEENLAYCDKLRMAE